MSNKEPKLEDFGVHIAGAKKETYFKAIDPAHTTTKTLPLSKLWADKDIKAIENKHIAALAYVFKDSMPNKPRQAVKVNHWLNRLHSKQNTIIKLLADHDPQTAVQHYLENVASDKISAKAHLLTHLERNDWKKIKSIEFYQNHRSDNMTLAVQIGSARHEFSPKQAISLQDYNPVQVIDEFAKNIQEIISTQAKAQPSKQGLSASSFVIFQRDKSAFIAAKSDRQQYPLVEFDTIAQARTYLKNSSNITELGDRWRTHREHHAISKADMRTRANEERSGQSYRDHDISPDEFMATFGIRGGQFGNWVNGDERQQMLNASYDGFMDLAHALNLEPKAIGLDGTLGIAFGARGSGNACAHYEPSEQVINLSKTRGAGNLAHEWWHALDHYMQGSNDLLTRQLSQGIPARNQQLTAPMRDLLTAIYQSNFHHRSQSADTYRNGAYFAEPAEMTARAFESYVQDNLAKQGIKNDFLVNIQLASHWQKNAAAYPYPTSDELESLSGAYGAVFDRLKEVDQSFVFAPYPPAKITTAASQSLAESQDIFIVPAEVQAQFAKDVDRLDKTLTNYPKPVQTNMPPVLLALDGNNNLSVKNLTLNLDRLTLHKMQGKVKARQDESHSMSLDDAKQILKEIYDPIAVLQNKNGQSLVVITSMKAKNNSTIITPIHLEKSKGSYIFHDLATSFGKENFAKWLENRLDTVVYYNKKKSLETNTLPHYWLDDKTVGVALAKTLNQRILNPAEIVKRYNELQQQSSPSQTHRPEQSAVHAISEVDRAEIGSIEGIWQKGRGVFQSVLQQNPNQRVDLDTATAENANDNKQKHYADNIENAIQGKPLESAKISIGKTPQVLQMLGVQELPVYIHRKTVLKDAIRKHNVSGEDLKRLPYHLENPVAIMRPSAASNNPDAYLVLTELTEKEKDKEKPVLAVLSIVQKIGSIEVSSVYGRRQSQIERDLAHTLYWNKEKGQQLNDSFGYQLSPSLSDANLSLNYKTESDLNQYILENTLPTNHTPIAKHSKDNNLTTQQDIFTVPTDIRAHFAKDVDRLSTSLKSNPDPIITKTPPALLCLSGEKGIAVNDLAMILDKKTLDKIQGRDQRKQDDAHRFSQTDVKNLLTQLYDPVAVFKTKNDNGLVAITEIQDNHDSPVIAIIHLDKQFKRHAVNDIASMYGKDNHFERWIEKNIAGGNLLYLNDKKSQNLVRLLQHRLSEMVHQAGIKPNILNPTEIVKRYNELQQKSSPSQTHRPEQSKIHATFEIDKAGARSTKDIHQTGRGILQGGTSATKQQQHQSPLNIITQDFSQNPAAQAVQERVMALAGQHSQELLNTYKRMQDTFGGRYIASDMMKEVFADFNQSPAHRNRFNNAVHNTAAALAALHFEQMLNEPITDGRNIVVFLTGCPGAGKTTSVMNGGDLEETTKVVFEGQLANAHTNPAPMQKIQQALDNGLAVKIVAVNPLPEQALENTFKRFYDKNDGRGAPISTMARIQGNTYDGLKAIHDKFGDQIELRIFDKPNGNQNTIEYIGWQNLNVLKSQGTEQEITQRLERHLINHYAQGKINDECFRQAAGSDARATQLISRLDRPLNQSERQNGSGREISPASRQESNQQRAGRASDIGGGISQSPQTKPQLSTKNIYINCPYSEKDQAKALGARWDQAKKSWYVPAGIDLAQFNQWLRPSRQIENEAQKNAALILETRSAGNQHIAGDKNRLLDKLHQTLAEIKLWEQKNLRQPNAQPQYPIPQSERLYLYTRPSDNPVIQKLKAQGIVKFDPQHKLWFAHQDNKDAVRQWTARPHVPSAEQALTDHLRSMGISVSAGHPMFDDQPHRLANDGSSDKNVMYHAYANPSGVPYARITNFSRGGVSEWTYPAEHLQVLKNIEAVDRATGKAAALPTLTTQPDAAKKDENKIALENLMAQRAKMVMGFAPIADNSQNYLAKKQVGACSVARIIPSSDEIPESLQAHIAIGNTPKQFYWLQKNNPDDKLVLQRGSLVIPQMNAQGDIRAFETIGYNGRKYALKDAEKSGLSTPLGELKNGEPIIVAEGYATGATLHENTGKAVVVAFGKDGLMSITKALRDRFPDSKIYIGADNDHSKEINAGLVNAKAVEKAVLGVYVLTPKFNQGDTGKDWNDVFVDKGIDEFKRQLKAQLAIINPQQANKAAAQIQAPVQEPVTQNPLDPQAIRQNHPAMSENNLKSVQLWRVEIAQRYADKPNHQALILQRLINKLPDYANGEILTPPAPKVAAKIPHQPTSKQNDLGR